MRTCRASSNGSCTESISITEMARRDTSRCICSAAATSPSPSSSSSISRGVVSSSPVGAVTSSAGAVTSSAGEVASRAGAAVTSSVGEGDLRDQHPVILINSEVH